MKKMFCLAFVLLSAVGIFAQEQERVIEKAEFDAALKNRFVKFAGQLYRQTTTGEDLPTETDRNKIYTKSVFEFAPSQRASRLLVEFDSSSIKTRRETILIAGRRYTRENGGAWTEFALEPRTERDAADRFRTVEEQTEYKSLGKQLLDNVGTYVYSKIERKKLVKEANKGEIFSIITTTYWLDEDGGIIKEETLTENRIKSEKNPAGMLFRNQRRSIWEFDPNIKIEAPILAK